MTLAELARVWTDVSSKIQTLAHASNSTELRSLAADCMMLAEKCAALKAPDPLQVNQIFERASEKHDFAQAPYDYAREDRERLMRQLTEEFKRRQGGA
jgi:hypothetical protein